MINTDKKTETSSKGRRILPFALAGAGMAMTGLAFAPAIASAQTDDTTPESTVEEATPSFENFLGTLVEDGTITQEQADSIAESLAERGFGRGHHRHGFRAGESEVVTELLGLTEAEIRTEIQAGNTLAEVAEAQGVPTQTLIDALVTEHQEHLDQAVTDGRLTEEEAAERSADLEERVTARVNGELEGRGRPGHGRRGAGPVADADTVDA
ncbi:MAG: hypothetical protein HKN03_01805 [Acidimicrobiales bacterium]|nr:hypothetical protein [Acidimicrobiales bacterium]